MIGVKFGSYNLQDPAGGVWVTDTDVYSSPTNTIQTDALAESDGGLVVKQRYQSKTFKVDGLIRGDSIAELDMMLDQFKAAMASKNQAFDIDYAGGVRRYLANAQNVVLTRTRRLTSAAFSVEFQSPDGVGWSLNSTALIASEGITGSVVSVPVTAEGSYQVDPLISATFNTVSGGTAKTVTISNDVTLRGLSVTRNWATGDVLEIDCLNKTVFVNDLATEFSGQFPKWEPGAGALGYVDNLTSRDMTLRASYTRRWL